MVVAYLQFLPSVVGENGRIEVLIHSWEGVKGGFSELTSLEEVLECLAIPE